MPYQTELIYNDADSIESLDDVKLPGYAHHTKIRAELDRLVEQDLIDTDDADLLYQRWRDDR